MRVTEDINDCKKLLNFQIELLVKYFHEKSLLSPSTIRSYAKIIIDYMTFSPTMDQAYLAEYISQQFLQNKSSTTWRSKLNDTLSKYAVWICKFLRRIYLDSSQDVSHIHYILHINELPNSNIEDLSCSTIYNTYIQLIQLLKFEDAVILNLI